MSTETASANVPPLTLGWRLQMALGHADMSVQEMADELGMARSSLSRWLNDRGTPPRTVFIKQWALRTGVSSEWLLTGHAESPRPGDPDGGEGVRHQGLEPRTRWISVSAGHSDDATDNVVPLHPARTEPLRKAS